MKIGALMTRDPKACRESDTLEQAARVMWEGDVGALPVVDDDRHVVGVITDRDVCMAAYTRGQRLADVTVASVATRGVATVDETDLLYVAENTMRERKVRRLPVLDGDGRLSGMISLGDLAHHLEASNYRGDGVTCETLARALAAVTAPQPAQVPDPPRSSPRIAVLDLLSDAENARVATGVTALHMAEGDEYVDLEHLDRGVQHATATTVLTINTPVPRSAVNQETWERIISRLKR